MVTVLTITTILLLILSWFLGTEMLKKFGFMGRFVRKADQIVISWYYAGKKTGRKPGMYNIVLRGKQSFSTLIGFKLEIPFSKGEKFDCYGEVTSDEHGVAVISTYLGNGAVEFQFVVSGELRHNSIEVTSTDADQRLEPHVKYPPHWYQRIGFYS